MTRTSYTTCSATETAALGSKCAAMLSRGDLVLVSGDLGAGKTTFIRGACRGLGIEEPVTSPSYIIGQLYQGSPAVAHIDLYRIDKFKGEEVGTLDDYITEERISFVEWPKSDLSLPFKEQLRVHIEHAGGDRRKIEIEGTVKGDI